MSACTAPAKRPSTRKRLLDWLVSNEGSLRARVFRSGIWLTLGNVFIRIIGLLRIIILGRLLLPVHFGLLGIGMLILQWLDYFSQSGFNAALIQKSEDPRDYLNTAWTIEMLRGVGLSVLVCLGAPLGGWFFRNPQATPMIRVIAVIFLLRGLNSPAVVCLRRALDFRKEVLWRLSGNVAGLLTAVVLAVLYRNAWALILSMVAAQMAETACSYWAQPFRPRLEIHRAKAREMFRFGRWILWNNFVLFPSRYLDSVAVGRFLGTSALGFYEMANRLALMPTTQIGIYLSGLMLPAFTRLEKPDELRRGFLRMFLLLWAFVLPAGAFLSIFALPLIRLVMGARWVAITPLVQVLVWAGALTAVSEIISAVLLRLGRPQLVTLSNLLKALVLFISFYPLMKQHGTMGIAIALLASSVLALAVQIYLIGLYTGVTAKEWAAASRTGFLACLPLTAAKALFQPVLPVTAGQAAIMALSGLAAAAIAGYFVWPQLRETQPA